MKTNILYLGDNLRMMRENIDTESIDLVYLDPPFNSKRNYLLKEKITGRGSTAQQDAFEDSWSWQEQSEHWYAELLTDCPTPNLPETIRAFRRFLNESAMMAYLVAMAIRLVQMHRVLKSTGSLYLHCDPTASHYLKILLDVIFGPENYRNKITWKRQSAHSDAKHKWADVADVILYYAKSRATRFTPQYGKHSQAYLDDFYNRDDHDGRGLYRLGDMASPNPRPNMMYEWRGFPCPAKGWRYKQETMESLHGAGRIYYPALADGQLDFGKRPALKRYLSEQEGSIVTNVWTDIAPVQAKGEALGYPTQKPISLLERIIEASTEPGDLVLDPFCGCGTSISAAHKLQRRWIGIDIADISAVIMKSRLEQHYDDLKGKVEIFGFPQDFESAKLLFHEDPHRFQIWACALIDAFPLTKKGADHGIDGWLNFYDYRDAHERALVQVKGGKAQVSHVRDFCHVINREEATLGFFLCMDDVTKPMREEAVKEGFWKSASGVSYPKIQILQIGALLAGTEVPRYPPQDKGSLLGYKAARVAKKGEQRDLGL